ncbi:ninein isoform X3 [Bufo bufo]|uniref:ninein isoform X3 n=1 Tax=Bufo bufo TaxID=8384 RepID=UPI001ABE1FEE|nr:ninein isoform X3 [Bufo bufo]
MEQDQYEARLKELFDSFDPTGTGSLGQEELTDLCHMLQLEEVAPSLQQALLQDNPHGRIHFDQFKEALIDALSSTLSSKENCPEPDGSPEAQPKYIKDGKRYGRRSVPELQDSLEEYDEETVIEPEDEGTRSSQVSSRNCEELWRNEEGEEYEAEGQLRFWNPDDLSASQTVLSPDQDWVEEKLQLICEDLGITRDGHLNRKKLLSICEQYGFQNLDHEALEDALQNLDQDDTISLQDFFYEASKNSKPPTPSSSTPYRQLKRHLSLQPYDETGRRTLTPSAMTGTIGLRLFSKLDDGTGYSTVEDIIDLWHAEGLENGPAILKALDFCLEGKINLMELTMTLENELLITKNEVYQAALVSFRSEIRHLLERADQTVREKEKLRTDLEKNEKLKSLMASEVDDHHAAIERRNEYNLRKLDEEYKERTTALKTELRKEREQLLQQANHQRLELEQELDKLKLEENYLRDRLTLSIKENSRMENELLETSEKLADCEVLTAKLQKTLDNILREKFGDLDPSCVEFFRHEEKLMQVRNEYERQRRELQDRIDELQLELEDYRAQGIRGLRSPLKTSLFDEMDNKNAVDYDQGIGSEDCPPLNMSIEAEMAIEQMREQHQREMEQLQVDLESKVTHYEEKLKEAKSMFEKEQYALKQKLNEELHKAEEQIQVYKIKHLELEANISKLIEAQQKEEREHRNQMDKMGAEFSNQRAQLMEQEAILRFQLEEAKETYHKEKEELVQRAEELEKKTEGKIVDVVSTYEEKKSELEQSFNEKMLSFQEKHDLEKLELQNQLLEQHELEVQEERCENKNLKEGNALLVSQINSLKEDVEANDQKHAELIDTCEDMWVNLETTRKERLAMEKKVDDLTSEVTDLKSRNEQLALANEELFSKNSKNQEDLQDLNLRMILLLKQKDRKDSGKDPQKWKEEIEGYKTKVADAERELSKVKAHNRHLEEDNTLLKQDVETKKLSKSSEVTELRNEISLITRKNEKLMKEKEALGEELNRCVAKSAKVGVLENKIASLKQEQKTWEQQSLSLKSQVAASQEQIQSLEENLQSVNLQMARLKSDLRVAQQEKESLKQEVMSLHKQLQNANAKKQVLEMAVHSSGLQNQQKKQYWDDLEQLMAQEQQLLRQENDRLQREVQLTKGDLAQTREKVRQLESAIISLKHQKQQSQSSLVKALEQEKSSLKRECDQLQKELLCANRKISQLSAIERELETIKAENEVLRAKQGKFDDPFMEMRHPSSGVTHSRSPLQQQACATLPREQYLQLQVDRRNQQHQATADNLGSGNSSPQGEPELLLRKMEGRMVEVEQKLRIVKMLLQEKVTQLKEQVTRNTRADATIKDLYVENSQLLKALEMSEQRHQTAEKKNYLLEEKISGLSKIVRDLTPAGLGGALTTQWRS